MAATIAAAMLLLFGASTSDAASITWSGADGTGLASASGNWVGSVVPGAADVAVFDSTSTINASFDPVFAGSLAGINVASSYTGTISLDRSMSVGVSGWVQAGGAAIGNASLLGISGPFTQSGGTFTASSATTSIDGDFARTGGTFEHNGGRVELTSTGAAIVSGSTTFQDLAIPSPGKLVTFTAATTQAVLGAFTVTGTSGTPVTLRSTTDGTQWRLSMLGSAAVADADVRDAGCGASTTTVEPTATVDAGGNGGCWLFDGVAPVRALTATGGDGQAALSWQNPSSSQFGQLLIYRATDDVATGTLVHSTTDTTTTSWTDTGLANGTTYRYRVVAARTDGTGARAQPGGLPSFYHADASWGPLRWANVDPQVDFSWPAGIGPVSPLYPGPGQGASHSNRWVGSIFAPTAGSYTLYAAAGTYDSATLKVDDATVASGSNCGSIPTCEWSGSTTLTVGWHTIELTHVESSTANYGGAARLSWSGPGIAKQVMPAGDLYTTPRAEATPTSGSLAVTAPAAGAIVRGPSATVDVTWSAASTTPAASTIRLGYSLDDGATVTMVRRSMSDSGSTHWMPPSGLDSTTARVVVEARTLDGRLMRRAMSDAFTIDTRLADPAMSDVSNLRATPGDGQVQLDWTNPASAAFDHANVYRSNVEGELGNRVAQVAAPTSTWTDSGLTNGTTGFYVVRAADASDREAAGFDARLSGSYYGDTSMTNLRWQQQHTGLDITWEQHLGPVAVQYPGPGQGINYSSRFHGLVLAPTSGLYSFYAFNREYESAGIYVDGTQISFGSGCTTTGGCERPGTIWLHAGWHSIIVTHREDGMPNWGALIRLSWSGPGITKQIVPTTSLGRPAAVEATPVAGSFSVTRPAAGDVVRVDGFAAPVEWSAATTPATSTVRLGYSLDDGATVTWFNRAASNTGSAAWTLPSQAWSTTARIVAEAHTSSGRILLRTMSGQFTIDTRTTTTVDDVTMLDAVSGDGQVSLTWVDPADVDFDHVNIYRSGVEAELGSRVAQVAKGTQSWIDLAATNDTTWRYTVRAADVGDRESANRDARLSSSYFADSSFTNLRWQEPTAQVDFAWGVNAGPTSGLFPGPAQGASYSSRWYGEVVAPASGHYTFYGTTHAYENTWIYVDGALVVQGLSCGYVGGCEYPGTIWLEPGLHRIEVRHSESTMPHWGATMRVSWRGPSIAKQIVPIGQFARSPIVEATPAVGTLSVISPAGGETFAGAGSTTPVSWDAGTLTSGATIRIGYSLDGGATTTWVHRGAAVADGTWTWPIPGDVSSSNARIVLQARTSAGRVLRQAISNAFAIDTQRAIGLANVTGLVAVPGDNTVQLDWTNPTSANFDHVNIYRSTIEGVVGTRVAQVTGTSWTDAGAANDTTYHYAVRAADSTNRESDPDARLQGSYYSDTTFSTLRWQEPATTIDFSWPAATGPISSQAPSVTQGTNYSTRWYGAVQAPASGTWTFYTTSGTYDTIYVTVDGVRVVETPSCGSISGCERIGTIALAQGWHVLEVRHVHGSNYNARALLSWSGPGTSKQVVPAASLGSWPTIDATPSTSTLALTSPAAGAQLGGAPNAATVEWTGASTPSGTIDVRWSLDDGATWRYVARGLATDASFAWQLPTGIQTTTGAVRVDHLNANGRVVRTSINRNLDIDTRISPPTGLTATSETGGLGLSWTAPADATVVDYAIYRASTVDGPWTLLGTVAGTTWLDGSGVPDTTYHYLVRSRDAWQRESYDPQSGGLRGAYFHGTAFDTARGSQDDASIDFDWGSGAPVLVSQTDSFSARWTGRIDASTAGIWSFQITHDDGVRMYVGNALVLNRWTTCTSCVSELRLDLTAGWHDIRLEFHENTGNAKIQLRAAPPAGSYAVVTSSALAQERSVAGTWDPPDWLTLTVPSGSAVDVGTVLPGQTVVGETTLEVSTNSTTGYSLTALGHDDAHAMDGPAPAVLAHRVGGVEPIDWPSGDPGYGLGVASAAGGKDTTRWGTGTTTGDWANLRYAAPTLTDDVLLHQRGGYSTAADQVVVGHRITVPAGQAPGSYSGTVTYTAVANP